MGAITQVDFVFTFAVSLEMLKKGRRSFHRSEIVVKHMKKLEHWAQMSPENHKETFIGKGAFAGLNNRRRTLPGSMMRLSNTQRQLF